MSVEVEEIKEYIDEKLNNKSILSIEYWEENSPQKLYTPLAHYCNTLATIKSMLDELEERPKAHWEETNLADELYGYFKKCTNCGYEAIEQCTGDFCTNCGARMNDELKE